MKRLLSAALVVAVATTGLVAGAGGASAASRPMQIGASVLDPRLGSGLTERMFFPQRLGQIPSGRPVSVTFSEWDTKDVERAVRQLAPGSTLGYYHEGERAVSDGKLTTALWAERSAEVAKIIAREGRVGQVYPEITFMGWSLFPASGLTGIVERTMTPDLVAWLKAEHGMIGWDQYAGPVPTQHTPMDDLFGHVARWSNARGLDWAEFEFNWGGARHNPDALAAFLKQSVQYVTSNAVPRQPRYMLLWNPTDYDHGIMATQQVPQAAAVWRGYARKY